MIGSLSRSSFVAAAVKLPASSSLAKRAAKFKASSAVLVANSPTKIKPSSAAPPIVVQANKPVTVVNAPALARALPPPPSKRPVVQAGAWVPAPVPSAALTSLAPPLSKPFYPSLGPGPSEVVADPGERLPPPTAGFSVGGWELERPDYSENVPEPSPARYDDAPAPYVQPQLVSDTVSVGFTAPSWMWIAGAVLVGGLGYGAFRIANERYGKGRKR